MRAALKWTMRVGLGLAIVAGLGVGGVFAASEVMLRRHWPKTPVSIVASREPAAIAQGARIAKQYGCHDCHGADLTGRLFHNEPGVAQVSGANLTLAIASQSDAELARAIRTGVAADGRGLWVMPSAAFSQLTDAETADLLTYLRTFKAKGAPSPGVQAGPVGRLGIVLGKFRSEPAMLKAGLPQTFNAGPHLAEGRALTRACTECHGADLKGSEGVRAPDLTVAASYAPDEFQRLMRTGVATNGRRLPMMSPTATSRFAALSDEEIGALHDYLSARAARMP